MRKLSRLLTLLLAVGAAAWYAVQRSPTLESMATRIPGMAPDTPVTRARTGAVADSDTAWALPHRGPATCGVHCGTERWAVKTLSDADRDLVHLRPVETTIEDLVALEAPSHRPAFSRIAPTELTVYRVRARIGFFKQESDRDWHLVLMSPLDTTITMIAEIPDPECAGVCSSGFAERFATVRQVLFDRLNATGGERRPLLWITGVAFFDFLHHQRGLAPNGIELHPVLAVEFP